jgi:hypothetical protein
MTASEKLQTAYQSSMQIVEDVMQAQATLDAAFAQGCVGANGILNDVSRCHEALNDAVRRLLEAQKRLVDTRWPESIDYASGQVAE